MKTYKITVHENGVTKYQIVQAKDKAEATQIAWELFDVDSVYVEEVYE